MQVTREKIVGFCMIVCDNSSFELTVMIRLCDCRIFRVKLMQGTRV